MTILNLPNSDALPGSPQAVFHLPAGIHRPTLAWEIVLILILIQSICIVILGIVLYNKTNKVTYPPYGGGS